MVASAHTGEKRANRAVYSITLNPRSFISLGCGGGQEFNSKHAPYDEEQAHQ
jgi:hypothetical protein